MCFGYVPIFIGGGEGLRVEQRGPVRGGKKTFFDCFLKDHPLSIGILEIAVSIILISTQPREKHPSTDLPAPSSSPSVPS